MNPRPNRFGRRRFVVGFFVFAGACVLLTLVGLSLYRSEVERITAEQHATLTAIGELKAEQIEEWRRENAFDAWRLAHGKFFRQAIDRLSDPTVAEELRQHLIRQASPDGANVLLFSPDGKLLLSAQDNSHDETYLADPALKRTIDKALASSDVVISDLYRCPLDKKHIDFAIAVRDEANSPLAVLVLRNEAESFLFPLTKFWPLPSDTAETVLITRDGDDLVFLNDLRHIPNAALNLRLPMSQTNLPAVQWLQGRTGIREGIDYRGEPVLANVHPIKDSSWIMVNKIDRKEVFRDLPRRTAGIILVAVLLLLLAAILVALLFIRHQTRITKSLRESEQRFRSVIEASPVPFALNDAAGNITDLNAAFTRTFGYTLGDIPTIEAWWPKAYPDPVYRAQVISEWIARNEEFCKNRTPFDPLEVNVQCKDGSTCTAIAMAAIMGGDSSGSTIVHLYDITARKGLENNLLEALGRAESANRAKGEFLAVMSHELRTPLNGVLGFADLLSETPLDEDQKELVETIQGSGSHLLQVVNDILDFSSMERKGVQLGNVRVVLADIIESACTTVRNDVESKGLALRIHIAPGTPESIEGDPQRIRQILINLLGNAVKFTSHGSVVLRVNRADTPGSGMIEFAVEDTGIGMSAKTLAILFQPFTQEDSTLKRKFEGTGLGLAISHRLAEAMGGRIDVVSTLGKGSTFTLCIPASLPKAQPASKPSAESSTPAASAHTLPVANAVRILVVEDDRVSALLTRRILSALSFESDLASDGQKAIDSFVLGKYAAILMDMQMPVVDGIQATRGIRAIERSAGRSRVPIIALTANVMPGDRETCLAAGMDDFVTKPINKNVLAEKLGSITKPARTSPTRARLHPV